MKRARMLQGLAIAGCFAAAPALGTEQDAPPEDAFLEFLGGFETADGEWVDPMALAGLDSSDEQSKERESDGIETVGDDEDET